jgi:hypothetical protein
MARLQAIDTAWTANGMRPVAYRLTTSARACWEEWYLGRAGSVFERRLDTYGHRLMLLLAAVSGRDIVDADIATAVVDLLRYQLDVRRECDPVDAENSIAAMEEKIRRALARGRLGRRELMRRVHYDRFGFWVWNTATENLTQAGELFYDPKTQDYWIEASVAVTTFVTTTPSDRNGQ